jgi:hypothetical protein
MKPETRTGFNHRVQAEVWAIMLPGDSDEHLRRYNCELTKSAMQLTVQITRGEMNMPRVSKPAAER